MNRIRICFNHTAGIPTGDRGKVGLSRCPSWGELDLKARRSCIEKRNCLANETPAFPTLHSTADWHRGGDSGWLRVSRGGAISQTAGGYLHQAHPDAADADYFWDSGDWDSAHGGH